MRRRLSGTCRSSLPPAPTRTENAKRKYCMRLVIWMLCALSDTTLRCVTLIFLLVGNRQNELDQMCSRISVALHGKDSHSGKHVASDP